MQTHTEEIHTNIVKKNYRDDMGRGNADSRLDS